MIMISNSHSSSVTRSRIAPKQKNDNLDKDPITFHELQEAIPSLPESTTEQPSVQSTSKHRRKVSDDSSNSDSDIANLEYANSHEEEDDNITAAWMPPMYRDTSLLAKAAFTTTPFNDNKDNMEVEQAKTNSRHYHPHHKQKQQEEQDGPFPVPALPASVQEPISPLRSNSFAAPPSVFTPPRSSIPAARSYEPTLEATSNNTKSSAGTDLSPTGSTGNSSSSTTSSGRILGVTGSTHVDLRPTDVVCGRGAPTSLHPGNRAYQKIIRKHAMEYLCSARSEKPAMAHKLMDDFRARGIRFVRRERNPTGGGWVWVPIGTDKTYDKVCQSLREGAPRLRRKLMRAAAGDLENNNITADDGGDDMVPTYVDSDQQQQQRERHEDGVAPATPKKTRARVGAVPEKGISRIPARSFETTANSAFDPAPAFGLHEEEDAIDYDYHNQRGGDYGPPLQPRFSARPRYETTHGSGWTEQRPSYNEETRRPHRFYPHHRHDPHAQERRSNTYYDYHDVRVPYYVHLPPEQGGEQLFSDRVFLDRIEYED